jgi:hypothetical protein
LKPTENRLLLESLSSNWAVEQDPLGVGHMPRVLWALEQSRCLILLAIGSCPDVRATTRSGEARLGTTPFKTGFATLGSQRCVDCVATAPVHIIDIFY